MADSYYVRIGTVDGARVVLHCLTGFTADATNYATSRSFALAVLLDAKTHAEDHEYLACDASEDIRRQLRRSAERVAAAHSPLHEALPDAESWDAMWCESHVPKFVSATKLLARHNVRPAQEAAEVMGEVIGLGGTWPLLEVGWQRLHHWDLEVELTDPQYAAHLVEGHLFATAAYDTWEEG